MLLLCSYRAIVLRALPNLKKLDNIDVTPEEVEEALKGAPWKQEVDDVYEDANNGATQQEHYNQSQQQQQQHLQQYQQQQQQQQQPPSQQQPTQPQYHNSPQQQPQQHQQQQWRSNSPSRDVSYFCTIIDNIYSTISN